MAWALPRLWRLEHAQGRAIAGCPQRPPGYAQNSHGRGHADLRYRNRRRTQAQHGHGGVRPCVGRWCGARLGDADRGRSRHRQDHVTLAGIAAACGAGRAGSVRLRRGVSPADQDAGATSGHRRQTSADSRGDQSRTDLKGHPGNPAGGRGGGFDSDGLHRAAHLGAGQHQPGAGSGRAADVVRQAQQRAGVHHRACHEGRRHRRTALAGTHRRYGTVFRRG